MRSEIHLLMAKNDLDGILAVGSGQHNPAMVYLTGGAHMTAVYLQKRGCEPVLYCSPIEREEASRTGIQTRSLADFDLKEMLREAKGDLSKALALRYQQMFQEAGLTSGRVAVYGLLEAGECLAVFTALQKIMPEVILVGEINNSMLMQARFTKDAQEVERIRQMGKITTEVMALVAEFLSSQRVEANTLIGKDDKPLTIGAVKNFINLRLTERGAENPKGGIFAIGREAGIPHSAGTSSVRIELGKPIVFDLYPCEQGGGYFYDCTRTWSLGFATDELLTLYEQVLRVYHQIRAALRVGEACPIYQEMACETFSQWGHPTIKSKPNLQEGYVHVLGHGVGLDIHERPWFGLTASEEDRLVPGVVFTLEPGLYYPEKGMGIRLEDTLWITPEGQIENLADYPMDLIVPIKG